MQKMQRSGDSRKDFAMIRMHHEHGVKMAKVELANGKSPAMEAMTTSIISVQKKEIAEFDQWPARQTYEHQRRAPHRHVCSRATLERSIELLKRCARSGSP